jgi:tRNA-2-methylthio-N6-dimethylallyladenosine synthase
MPYLHLPVQSGSDRILEAMNRRHGRDLFLDIVRRLLLGPGPGSALSSDFIVGFPARADANSTTPCCWSTGRLRLGLSFKYSAVPARRARPMARRSRKP